MKIYTIGHLSPDLDAITSAVAYAEYLTVSKKYNEAIIVPLRPGSPNKEVEYIFNKFSLPIPKHIGEIKILPEDKIILVDHNEPSQRHPIIKPDQIIEILDHHKINVSFNNPIKIDIRPLGATATIILDYFELLGVSPTPQLASAMVCAILSDTLGLKAATTTEIDVRTVEKLTKNFSLNTDELIFDVFKAKSDLSGMSFVEIVKKDYKMFEFSGKKVFIGGIETVEPEKVLESKQDLVTALGEVKKELGADLGFIFVSDILKIYSIGIYQNDDEKLVLNKAFSVEAKDFSVHVGSITSRKKDIAPAIEKALILSMIG